MHKTGVSAARQLSRQTVNVLPQKPLRRMLAQNQPRRMPIQMQHENQSAWLPMLKYLTGPSHLGLKELFLGPSSLHAPDLLLTYARLPNACLCMQQIIVVQSLGVDVA